MVAQAQGVCRLRKKDQSQDDSHRAPAGALLAGTGIELPGHVFCTYLASTGHLGLLRALPLGPGGGTR